MSSIIKSSAAGSDAYVSKKTIPKLVVGALAKLNDTMEASPGGGCADVEDFADWGKEVILRMVSNKSFLFSTLC